MRHFLLPTLVLASAPLLAQELYTVRPNDILSRVLIQNELRPLYGPQGSLNKTIRINPKLQKHKGNRIYVGQEIYLPIEKVALEETRTEESITQFSERTPIREYQGRVFGKVGAGFISSKLKDFSGMSGSLESKNYFLASLGHSRRTFFDLIATFQFDYHNITLAQDENVGHSQNNFSMLGYNFDLRKNFTHFSAEVGLNTKPLVLPYKRTAQNVEIDSQLAKMIKFGISKEIKHHPYIATTLDLNGLYMISQKSTAIQIKNGMGLEAKMKSEYKKNLWGISGEVSFTQLDYKTDISKTKTQVGTLSVGLTYDLK